MHENPERRLFLERLVGLALTGALGATTGCAKSPVDTLRAEDARDKAAMLAGDELAHALWLGSLAPSSHNIQPWMVNVLEPDRWAIGCPPRRRLPAVDPANREPILSLGAFLENLLVAGEAKGYRGEYRIVAAQSTDPVVLELAWKRQLPRDYPMARLEQRRTLRGGYRNRELSADDLAFIAEGLPQCHYIPAGSAQSSYLAAGTIAAMRAQSLRDLAQRELAQWIRWSPEAQRERRDGLTPASMEIDGVAGWYASRFYTADSVLTDDFRKTGVDRTADQARAGAGWIVMTSPDASVVSLIESGRHFERLALRVRERGIAVQPMTQMLEEAPWRDAVAGELRTGAPVQWILRVGYVDRYPGPVSPRRSVAAFVRAHPSELWTNVAQIPS
jgi:nitroreductase